MAAKQEPSSPQKEFNKLNNASGDAKGKGKQRQTQADAAAAKMEFDMADWVQDPAIWSKVAGEGTTMSNISEPVKTIEVSLHPCELLPTLVLCLLS